MADKKATKTTKKTKPKLAIEKMKKEECCEPVICCDSHKEVCKGGAIYGLGFIGAAIYYISTATGFWMVVLGFLKALVWPLFLVLEALKFLKA